MPKSIILGRSKATVKFSTPDCFKEAVDAGWVNFDKNDFCVVDISCYDNTFDFCITKQNTIKLRDVLTSIIDGD